MRYAVALLVLAGLAGCTSMTPINDPVYLRIQDLEARLIQIESVVNNESLIELARDISSLRNEVQSMLGDVETLRFELERQADGQSDLYVNLDQRISALEEAQSRLASQPVASSGAPVAGVSDQQAYDAAFALIERQDFVAARTAFERFLATYPNSTYRSNAQYWLAEMHYAQLDFTTALAEFQRVLTEYPQSSKVPDALVKIGFCNIELGNDNAARQALLRVVREFPNTAAADTADARLAELSR